MILNIIYFLGLLCTVKLFTSAAEPIEMIKQLFNIHSEAVFINPIQWFIMKLVNCNLCTGWWFGLIFYKSFLLAAIVSVCAELMWRIIKL